MYAVTKQPAKSGSFVPAVYHGLECLESLNEVLLEQDFVYRDRQLLMRFDIRDPYQRQLFSVEDDLSVKTWSHFTFNITDGTSAVVLQVKQSVVGCNLDIQITSAHGTVLAYVMSGCHACLPSHIVVDESANAMANFEVDWCENCGCSGDFVSQIRDPQGTVIGRLVFVDEGCCRIYKNFKLQFGADTDLSKKVVLLGAAVIFIAHYRKRGPASN